MQKLTAMKFNERVSFLKVVPSSGPDPGENVEVFLTCWCYFKNKTVYDIQRETTTGLENTINFYIRYEHTREIDNTMQVEFKETLYNIVGINPAESEKDFTLITAKQTN